MMKTINRWIASVANLLVLVGAVMAQSKPDIIMFRDGQITWTNANPALYYTVEWLSTMKETNWTGSFRSLQDLRSSASTMTAGVPIFLRIAGSSNAAHTATFSATTAVVSAGYYAATNLAQVTTNLVAGNIRKGVTLFGVVGTLYSSGATNRYWDHGNGTVTDQETGLMWTKNANHGQMNWAAAVAYCDNFVTNGYSDWRLPSVNRQDGPGGPMGRPELDTLGRPDGIPGAVPFSAPGAPFTGVQSVYWSSTSYAVDSTGAWRVDLTDGSLLYGYKTLTFPYVWPVRGGQ
jgi:hypothetical protein